jgi:hypothetical protein
MYDWRQQWIQLDWEQEMSGETRWRQTRKFFEALHGEEPKGFIEIRPNSREDEPSRQEREAAGRHRKFIRGIDEAVGAARAAERAGLNVLAGVALRAESGFQSWRQREPRAGGIRHLLSTRAIYLDMDMPRSEAEAKLRDFALEPSMLVESSEGGGMHAYWLLSEPLDLRGGEDAEVHEWHRNVVTALAKHLGGDPGAKDTARVMRVPGTTNRVNSRKRARGRTDSPCILYQEDNGRRYTCADFDRYADEGTELRAATRSRARVSWDGEVDPEDDTVPPAVQTILDTNPRVRERFDRVPSDTQGDTSASSTDLSLAMMLCYRGIEFADIRQALVASRLAAHRRGVSIKRPDAQYYDRTVEEAVGRCQEQGASERTPPSSDGSLKRPRIIFNQRELRDVADDALRALIERNLEAEVPKFFNRNGRVAISSV